MEKTLAILMVLGIFVVIPAIIGFATAGVYALRGRQRIRAEQLKEILGAVRTKRQHGVTPLIKYWDA